MSGVRLEVEGRFKAKPTSWTMRTRDSGAVCVSIGYAILAQYDYDEETWVDWSEADEHYVYGDHYVIKKDGTTNVVTVEQLYAAIGWEGDPDALLVEPPNVVVQISVERDEYQGKVNYKVTWLDRGDAVPRKGGSKTAAPEDLVSVKARFGGALRAAAAAAKAKVPVVPASTAPTKVKSTGAPTEEEYRAAQAATKANADVVTSPAGTPETTKFDNDIPF